MSQDLYRTLVLAQTTALHQNRTELNANSHYVKANSGDLITTRARIRLNTDAIITSQSILRSLNATFIHQVQGTELLIRSIGELGKLIAGQSSRYPQFSKNITKNADLSFISAIRGFGNSPTSSTQPTDPMAMFKNLSSPKVGKNTKAMGGMMGKLGKLGPKMLLLGIAMKMAQGVFAPFSMFMDTFGAFGEILGTAFLPVLIPINNTLIKAIPYLIVFADYTGKLGAKFGFMLTPMFSLIGYLGTLKTDISGVSNVMMNLNIGQKLADIFDVSSWDLSVVSTAFTNFGSTILGYITGMISGWINSVSDWIYERTGIRL